MSATLDAARHYVGLGWKVIPIPLKQKGSRTEGWQHLRLQADELSQHFTRPVNIGVLNGEVSDHSADVDLDCAEALALADECLPSTWIFGRSSRPRSHWVYRSVGAITRKWEDPTETKGKKTLVELRATSEGRLGKGLAATATLIPPSVHPEGEIVEWDAESCDATPGPLDVDAGYLLKRVTALAVAALIARHSSINAARASRRGEPLPSLPPLVLAQVKNWLGIREPVRTVPSIRRSSFDDRTNRLERLRFIHPAVIAQAFGVPADERGISQCPVCSLDRRSDSDRRVAVAFTAAPDGAVLWHHAKCGSHGNSVQLAALLVLGKPRPNSPTEWSDLHRRLDAAGVC
jgi:hypothetical protein